MSKSPVNPDKPQQAANGGFLLDALLFLKEVRWAYLFVAFCLSITLWYTVTVRDKVESWVDVQVVFKGAPDNLVISEGLINKLAVRVRAARGLSRSLTGREATVAVDLSAITRGSNAITVKRDMLPFGTAYEVMEVSPPRIQITADILTAREIELEYGFNGKLAQDLFVKSINITPSKVVISGADSLVSGISRIKIPIPLGLDIAKGVTELSVAVPAPTSVAVTPPQVAVNLQVGVRTKQMRFTRTVEPTAYKDGRRIAVKPEKVTIVADIPEGISKDAGKAKEVVAQVALPPDLGDEPQKLPVTVLLPENATLVSVTPAEVEVSHSSP